MFVEYFETIFWELLRNLAKWLYVGLWRVQCLRIEDQDRTLINIGGHRAAVAPTLIKPNRGHLDYNIKINLGQAYYSIDLLFKTRISLTSSWFQATQQIDTLDKHRHWTLQITIVDLSAPITLVLHSLLRQRLWPIWNAQMRHSGWPHWMLWDFL